MTVILNYVDQVYRTVKVPALEIELVNFCFMDYFSLKVY